MKYLHNVKRGSLPLLCAALTLLFCVILAPARDTNTASSSAYVKSVFGNQCDILLIEQINSAKKEISTAIFSITHRRITKAFTDAAKRGARVTIKYDVKQAEFAGMQESLKRLTNAGITCIPVKMKENHTGMHHKFTIIDNTKVLTGSFNYTVAGATRNYENLILISSTNIASAFQKEFDSITDR